MLEVVDILVRGETFSSRYDTQKIPVKPGDSCLVESGLGMQIGQVISNSRVVKARCVGNALPKIIRKASEADLESVRQLQQMERDAHRFCVQKIQFYRLEMKLVKVMFSFDRSKGLFMFTSEGRVDFRELVRDLAQHFKARIEMKQIGIRDEARILGGIGNCGFPLCCVTFLRDFHPVSIKMAKDQGLSLIPSKISGLCGRLMCCLQYEHEHYACQVRSLPKVGKRVMTPSGEGRVRQLGILKNTVLVELPDGKLEDFPAGDVIPMHKYLEQKDLTDNPDAQEIQLPEENGTDQPIVSDPETVSLNESDRNGRPDADLPEPSEKSSLPVQTSARTADTEDDGVEIAGDVRPSESGAVDPSRQEGNKRRFGGHRRRRPRSGRQNTPSQ